MFNPVVEHFDQGNFDEVWTQCTELAKTMAYPAFFCSGDWLKACAENICPGDELSILLVKSSGCIIGVLPLVRTHNALRGTDFRYLGSDFYPDPLGLISSPANREICAKALQKYLRDTSNWDRLFLDWVLEDELTDWRLTGKVLSEAPFKMLPRDFSELLKQFKKKKRYNLRAMAKKIIDAGGEFVASADTNSNIFHLEKLFLLHAKRAAEKSLDSSFLRPRVQSLHRTLTFSDRVRFYGLKLNDKIIAVIYGFEFCNRFFYYQVAHDPAFGYLSPGSVLLYFVIESCCSRGVAEFNFLQGNETYKSIWTTDSRILYRCVLNSSTWRSNVLNATEEAKAFIKRVWG
jgi:CelD/BcsL family acetyltransferase involved in cellulose biosynthesis